MKIASPPESTNSPCHHGLQMNPGFECLGVSPKSKKLGATFKMLKSFKMFCEYSPRFACVLKDIHCKRLFKGSNTPGAHCNCLLLMHA